MINRAGNQNGQEAMGYVPALADDQNFLYGIKSRARVCLSKR